MKPLTGHAKHNGAGTTRRGQVGCLLAIVATVGLYNLPQLVAGSVQFDGVDVHYSAQRYLSDELHSGRLPIWTPYIFSGFPFLADLQVGAWYPLNWPFFLLGIVPRSIGAELALHNLIACFGTYLLASRLLGPGVRALAAAIFYALSGWFAAHSQHVGMFDTAAWLPWLLLLLEHLAQSITLRRLALGGLLGAAIALPGHFQVALYTFSFIAIWAACESLARRSWHITRRWAIGLAVVATWGGLLSAVMILPALELVSQSVRTQVAAAALPDIGYFHPGALLTLVDPDYYGLLSGHYSGPGDSSQHYFYGGILLVPLALLGLRNPRIARSAAFLALPFLWYALGPSGGLFRLVARLPGFSSVELPMHGWFLPALGLALLGGAGMAAVERSVGQRWAMALLVLAVLDVLTVNQLLNPLAYPRASFETLYGTSLQAFSEQLAQAAPPVERLYGLPLSEIGYRNHALQSRVETTYGYNPLELEAYAEYVAAAEANPRLLDGFAANYQLAGSTLQPLRRTLPLADVVHSVIGVPDRAAAGGALADFDPSRATIVVTSGSAALDPSATADVVQRDDTSLVIHYASGAATLVRVAIPWYPGWHATLNGVELPVLQADLAFTAVQLPAGAGDVELAYSPRLLLPGVLISALALVVALVALVAQTAAERVEARQHRVQA